jgi:hypothetical protein
MAAQETRRAAVTTRRMADSSVWWFAGAVLVVSGCGGSQPDRSRTAAAPPAKVSRVVSTTTSKQPAATPAPAIEATEVPPEAEAAELDVPTECATPGSKPCLPPTAFVEQLCKARSVDLALTMFRRTTPWTRAYLRRNMEAWYTATRLTSPVQLVLDEEVIVIASRTGASGAVVVGGGSYDVYRWDGKCVSVMADEVTLRRPPIPGAAPIAWKALSEPTRDALLGDRGIKFRRDVARDRCSADGASPKCEEANNSLGQLIADYVRRGGKLPDPRLSAR